MAEFDESVVCGDSRQILRGIEDASVHLILSDIPYGIGMETWDVLHANTNSALQGASPAQRRAGSVFRSRGKPLNGWSEADRQIPHQYYEWCLSFAPEWLRILKPGGSALVFAGRRFAHRCTCAFEDAGFIYKDMAAWLRKRAPHRAQRLSLVFDRRGDQLSAQRWAGWRVGNLRPIFEPVLWFTKPYKIGHTLASTVLENEVGAFNEIAFTEYMGRPDNVLSVPTDSSDTGEHTTQKPLLLMKALIELTTLPGHLVVDPFCGSGTTLVAAACLGRKYLGIDLEPTHCQTARRRLVEASTPW